MTSLILIVVLFAGYPVLGLVTTKWEIVFSTAILAVLLSSSEIVSPGLNFPDKVVTKSWFPEENDPETPPSITPYAPLTDPTIYFPVKNVLEIISLSNVIRVKKEGLK